MSARKDFLGTRHFEEDDPDDMEDGQSALGGLDGHEEDNDNGNGKSVVDQSGSKMGGGKAKGKGGQGAEPPLGKAEWYHSAAQLRRDQNRVAQREFRQRKQQHIRDLEARVQILSGDREERQEIMAHLVHNLLKENAQLRKVVKDLSAFIGEGLATCLPRMGMTLEGMEAFVNRAETETAHEAYAALKAARDRAIIEEGGGEFDGVSGSGGGPAGGSGVNGKNLTSRNKLTAYTRGRERSIDDLSPMSPSPSDFMLDTSRKRPSDGSNSNHQSAKKARTGNPPGTGPSYHLQDHDQNQDPVPPRHPGSATSERGTRPSPPGNIDPSLELELAGHRRSSIPPNLAALVDAASYSSSAYGPNPGGHSGQDDPVASRRGSEERRKGSGHSDGTSTSRIPHQNLPGLGNENETYPVKTYGQQAPLIQAGLGNAPERFQQACELLMYHLRNYQSNAFYHLPPPLIPTEIQRTIPHEHLIDGLIFPAMRDRMIICRGRYDIMKVFGQIFTEWSIPGEDMLDQNSWEISERWFKDNPLLIVTSVIEMANRWRVARGEEPMTRESLCKVVEG